MSNKFTPYNNAVLGYTFGMATTMGIAVLMAVLQQNGVSPSQGVNFWLINALYSVCIGAVAVAILLITKQPIKQTLGLSKNTFDTKKLATVLATVFVLLNVMVVANNWFVSLLNGWGCNLPTSVLTKQQITDHPALAILVACILPAINEELLFRGLVAKGLAQKFGNVASIFATGLLFALFHGNPAQTLHQFVLGCLLSFVCLSTNSVILPVVAHFFNNLSALLLALYVEPTNVYSNYGWIILTVGAVLLVALAYPLIKQFKLPQATDKQTTSSPYDVLLFAMFAFGVYLWVGAL